MRKRFMAGIVAAGAALALGPLAGTASACTDTVQQVIAIECSTRCPYPTQPRAAVYVDGHWVIVCL